VTDGGNPGAFLRATGLTTAIPVVENMELPSPTNPFLGRYRIDGVSELVLSEQAVPRPGVGWKTYRFNVPSWKQAMPQKWVARGTCAGMPRDDAWNFVMGGQYINAVHFYVGDPAGVYPVQTWTIGVENVRVSNGKFGTPSQGLSRAMRNGPMSLQPRRRGERLRKVRVRNRKLGADPGHACGLSLNWNDLFILKPVNR